MNRTSRLSLATAIAVAVVFVLAPRVSVAAAAARPQTAAADRSFATRPVRDARTLPTLSEIAGSGRVATPMAPIVTPTDSFLVRSWGFDGIGTCEPRGFVGEDRSNNVFAHVSDAYVVNQSYFRGVPYAGPGNSGDGGRLYPATTLTVDPTGRVLFNETGAYVRILRTVPGTLTYTILAESTDPGTFNAMTWDPILGTFLTSAGVSINRWDGPLPLPGLAFGGGASTQDTTSAESNLGGIAQLAADAAGNLYWADLGGHRIRMLRRNDLRVITLVGNGTATSTGDGGPGTAATVGSPGGVAIDDANDLLYFTDAIGQSVRVLNLATGVVNAVVTGSGGSIISPSRLTLANNALYFIDYATGPSTNPSLIRRYDLGTSTLSVVAGGAGYYGPSANASLGTALRFVHLDGLAADAAGNVFFLDRTEGTVLQLTPAGLVSAIAGASESILMGTRALRFGADMTSAPEEVANWVQPSGFGNGWSQRLVSPLVDVSALGTVLTFDGVIELGNVQDNFIGLPDQDGEFIVVQALETGGGWTSLFATVNPIEIQNYAPSQAFLDGWLRFKATVDFDGDVNSFLPLATPTRIRFVVQTGISGSPEDGLQPTDHPAGAAVLDNIVLSTPAATLQSVNFEDGTLGGWTLEALNGDPTATFVVGNVRDVAVPPETNVALQSGFDFNDASCVWTFLSEADSVARRGIFARLTTPWFATPPSPDMLVAFSGKLNTKTQVRFLSATVRGKNAGDSRPAFIAPSQFLLNSGTLGHDVASPYLNQVLLRYPQDFGAAAALADSMQLVFEVTNPPYLIDPFTEFPMEWWSFPQEPTALPYLDNIQFYALGVDSDFDGVANVDDACPSENAAGQDQDGDGCVDATATMREVESWNLSALPLRYSITAGGDPDIADDSEVQVVHDAFQVWASVPGAALTIQPAPQSLSSNASALDGINLVTWADPDFPFPPNVVAVTPTLSFTKRGGYQDVVARPGQIVDADLLFNPALEFRTPTHDPGPTAFDLKSVAVHEIGHFIGLSHSGVLDASMFFVLQPGADAATLTDDDRAAVAAAFPGPALATDFGTIEGRVLRGGTNAPVPGALVTAVRLGGGGSPTDSAASDYTDELGRYTLHRLAPGDYAIRVTPLDGEVGGWPLGPEYISLRIYTIAETNFAAEWWDAAESNTDDPDDMDGQAVVAGATIANVDIITNNDTTAPMVTGIAPSPDTTGINIDTNVLVSFSERIDLATVSGQSFQFRRTSGGGLLPGYALLVNGERRLIFSPSQPLQFGEEYEVKITTALTDREGVPLASDYVATFSTIAQPPLAITDIQPRKVLSGASYITILGAGFADTTENNYVVMFTPVGGGGSNLMIPVPEVSEGSMIVLVPNIGASDSLEVRVVMGTDTSNVFNIFVESPPAQVNPTPLATAPLAWSPSDVVLSPDNERAIAVGSGGLATVDLSPLSPADYGSIGAARQIALMPDGLHGYATRPDSGDVVEVDLDPNSGTYRELLAEIELGDGTGRPLGIALDAAGTRAHVTDPFAHKVFTIDVDMRSVTRNQVLIERPDTSGTPNEGIAVHPANFLLAIGNSVGGVQATAPGSLVDISPYDNFVGSGGVAFSPGGIELLVMGGNASNGLLLSKNTATLAATTIATGGNARDVAFMPLGQSALVVNSQFNQVMVLNTATSSPEYHEIVSVVPTGSTPVAIDVSSDGSRVGVANASSNDLSIFSIATGGPVLLRVQPPVALAGDAVSFRLDQDFVQLNTDVEFNGQNVDVSHVSLDAVGGAAQLPVDLETGDGYTAVNTTTYRTNALPLRIVPPIQTFAPVVTGQSLTINPQLCSGLFVDGIVRRMRVSPDGRLLATLTNMVNCPEQYVRVYRFDDQGPGPLHTQLGAVQVNSTAINGNVDDIAWSPDGLELWATRRNQAEFARINADPNSPSFLVTTLTPDPVTASQRQIMQIPAEDDMLITFFDGISTSVLIKLRADGTIADSLTLLNLSDVWALGVSPDGRTVVVGGNESTVFVTNGPLGEITRSGNPAGIEGYAAPSEIVFTTDGRRAVALHGAYGYLSVWNIDPSAGPIGQLQSMTSLLDFFGGGSSLVPGNDGHSVLVGSFAKDSLAYVDVATVPPTVAWVEFGRYARVMTRSFDGRRLYFAESPDDGGNSSIELLSVTDGTSMFLVSGAGQTAPIATALPLPIRVRVEANGGAPQPGVLVQFTEATGGSFVEGNASVSALTNANGEAEVHYVTPPTPGSFQVTAAIPGSPSTINVAVNVVGSDAETPPVIVQFGPVEGQTNLNANTAVFVRFNQSMDSASVASRMSLSANTSQVPGSYDVVEDGHVMIFRPTGLLPFSAACSLSVAAGAVDTDGQSLVAGGFARFTVQPEPVLSLTSIYPPAGPPATQVVISGQGFSAVPAQNQVLFSGVPATVISSSLLQITASVPLTAVTGDVTVQVGVAVSNPVPFTVLAPNANPGGIVATLDASQGVRDIAITSDGARAYATNPGSSSVTAYDLEALQVLTSITVGLKPQSIAITPDDRFAYVANTDSDNLSVIDIDPLSPTYHTVVATIPVGDEPVDIAISPIGPEILVLCAGAATLSSVDADPNSGTYQQVTSTVSTGSQGKGVAVSPDGGTAYVITDTGDLLIIDLASDLVVTTVSTGSSGKGVAVTPDGGLAIVLLEDGTLVIVDVNPESETFAQVTSTVSTGSQGKGVAVSPDGGLVYVTTETGNVVLVFVLGGGAGGAGASIIPGDTPGTISGPTLTLQETIEVGEGPEGVTPSPTGMFALVPNAGDGTVTVIGLPGAFSDVEVLFDFNPNTFNLSSTGQWVQGTLVAPDPWLGTDFVVSSILLENSLPVDPAGGVVASHDSLVVKFDRLATSLLLPLGNQVPVVITGQVGSRNFVGRDTIRVRRTKVNAPHKDEVVPPGVPYVVRWEVPENVQASSVALLQSLDKGRTWTLVARDLPNDGDATWTPPLTISDTAKVAVVLIESSSGGDIVEGVLGVSDVFRLYGYTDVRPRPQELSFARIAPNPARGAVTMRFGLPHDADVKLEMFDLQGRRVQTLASGRRPAGWHEATWNGEARSGVRARPGLYFARFTAEGRTFDQRLVWLQ